MHAGELLLHLVLKCENRRARLIFARSELAQLIGKLAADLQPVEPRILAVQTIQLAGATPDLGGAALGRKWDDRPPFGGGGTAGRLDRGVRGHGFGLPCLSSMIKEPMVNMRFPK